MSGTWDFFAPNSYLGTQSETPCQVFLISQVRVSIHIHRGWFNIPYTCSSKLLPDDVWLQSEKQRTHEIYDPLSNCTVLPAGLLASYDGLAAHVSKELPGTCCYFHSCSIVEDVVYYRI